MIRRLPPDDRAASTYLAVPFEVPAGTVAVTVRLSYDRTEGLVDLGCEGAAGWRGWSGGARDRFTIAAAAATPGYLPGEPEPGQWSVVLGLHRIPAHGLDVTVEVSRPARSPAATPGDPVPEEPPAPERPPRRILPAAPGLTWYAGDFHAHTVHSDGSLRVAELAARAVAAGLDILAVTDHNTVSHHAWLPAASRRYGVSLVPGQEVTTDRGHANAFGAIGWVDFRRPATEWVRQVREAGGLLSINHPLAMDCAWHQPLTERPPLAEIWHWSWFDRTWTAPLAWWMAWGRDTVPVGGSDFHSPDQWRPLAEPVTWVAAESTEPAAVLAALRAGRTAVSAGIDAPVLLRVEDELVAVGADGVLLADAEGWRRPVHADLARFPTASSAGPYRLETPRAEVLAISR
jgi:hypothetical protein